MPDQPPLPLAGKPERLVSLDAYRGFVMLAMASSGLHLASKVFKRPAFAELFYQYDGTPGGWWWETFWKKAAYQLDHVAWTGCSFWDLIQPSFMFMVGVALPFSFSRRASAGASEGRLFAHAMLRAFLLVLLGIFLSSTGDGLKVTNFTFVNVLTQIGLGYPLLYLLSRYRGRALLAHAVIILAGYWGAFALYTMPAAEYDEVTDYIQEKLKKDESEWKQFEGFASHWNKHTNFAAAVDRRFLNLFPRNESPWHEKSFWVNPGGYATLNFIPSLATMIFGLIAGQLLFGADPPRRKIGKLFLWGLLCFAFAMAVDTTTWPVHVKGCDWTICPAVKRIWTPTWAVFSTGWCFWILGAFYAVIDVAGYKRWAFPLAITGMNSIAIYCFAQTMKGWLLRMLTVHSGTVDAVAGTKIAASLSSDTLWYTPIVQCLAEVTLLWLIMLWMYRRKLFVRV